MADLEALLRYHPAWTGGGFREFRYAFPDWAEGVFELETVYSYREELLFSREAWRGRGRTCRALGASLPPERVREFDLAYRQFLEKYAEPLKIKHQLHLECCRLL